MASVELYHQLALSKLGMEWKGACLTTMYGLKFVSYEMKSSRWCKTTNLWECTYGCDAVPALRIFRCKLPFKRL